MKYLVILTVLFFGVVAFGANVTLTKYSESVYICEDQFFSKENSIVYIGSDSITIIGATWCPDSAKALHDLIVQISDKPVLEVVNTNYHPDRAGGNSYWKGIGCEIHATEITSDLMKSDWAEICEWTRSKIPNFPEIPLVIPTRTHNGSFQLQEGRLKVLYLGPSHTEDGVFVYLPMEKVLYGGCIIKPFLGNLEQANIKEYPKTLNKLKDLNLEIKFIIAGHGRPVHDIGLIDYYLGLLQQEYKAEPVAGGDATR